MKIRIELSDGEDCHWLYGKAWFDYRRGRVICYPFPLNWVVSIAREIFLSIRDVPKR